MGVYINMEIPTARDTLVLVKTDGTAIVYEDETYVTTAVPVPPHGDLIDGNAIAVYIEKQISEKDKIMALCKSVGDIENYFSLSKIQTGMVLCRRALDNAPTIIPASEEKT